MALSEVISQLIQPFPNKINHPLLSDGDYGMVKMYCPAIRRFLVY